MAPQRTVERTGQAKLKATPVTPEGSIHVTCGRIKQPNCERDPTSEQSAESNQIYLMLACANE